jgi:hypothetical protein
MRPAVFGSIILTPVIWFVILSAVGFFTGFFWPAAWEYLVNNVAFSLGVWLGTIAIILTPLSKKGRSDYRDDFDRTYHRFYTEEAPASHQESERKPTQQKQVKAAITVASNLYLHTIPGAEDAPVPLQFSLPDSRYRYLIFCLSAIVTACAREMKNHDAVVNECLHSLVMWTTTENVQEFFGGPVNPQDVANNGAAYLQEFLNNWSRYVDLDKEGRYTEGVDLICSMIHTTESNVPAEKADEKRLGELGLQIACRLPTMRGAFIELVNQ